MEASVIVPSIKRTIEIRDFAKKDSWNIEQDVYPNRKGIGARSTFEQKGVPRGATQGGIRINRDWKIARNYFEGFRCMGKTADALKFMSPFASMRLQIRQAPQLL
jgi:hypothetical protein